MTVEYIHAAAALTEDEVVEGFHRARRAFDGEDPKEIIMSAKMFVSVVLPHERPCASNPPRVEMMTFNVLGTEMRLKVDHYRLRPGTVCFRRKTER